MEAELRKELKRLQEKYSAGFELELVWQPTCIELRPTITRADGKVLKVCGEWHKEKITIYEDESLNKAMHTLHHEFLECIIMSEMVDPYVVLSNALQNVFRTLQYANQERVVERFAKVEDKEYDTLSRKHS